MDDGRLTDGQGRHVDFRNTVVIMTSNVGAEAVKRGPLGFSTPTFDESKYTQHEYAQQLETALPPRISQPHRRDYHLRVAQPGADLPDRPSVDERYRNADG
jgi:ATP-dependent Clp protease ATP-binding subunit ClpA